jgi:hypothetical protein
LPLGYAPVVTMGPAGPYGFRDTLRTLWAGGTVVLLRSLEELAARLELDRVTWLVAPPATLISLVGGCGNARSAGAGRLARDRRGRRMGQSAMSPALYQAGATSACARTSVVSLRRHRVPGPFACAPMEAVLGRPGAVGQTVLPRLRGPHRSTTDGRELPRGAPTARAGDPRRGVARCRTVDDDEGSRRRVPRRLVPPRRHSRRFDDDGVVLA